ncbi:hypothetical protein B0H15DRAFT_823677 [Mycena belliarum]|uniref:Methyltransferase-domain-containing protein n=1 Tax=Mycena belliarum TaxID=1033014 RepID=A0AAD6XRF5_9AGAR|nr:hypothetical protein B0H15DRAFT_823677 [Mycena belliae]
MLPASHSKHSKLLLCPFASTVFRLVQSDDGVSNGTALWLGAQCLSAYLAYAGVVKPGMRALELGGGIGLSALCLANLGCTTITTDLPVVISTCLARNIENNVSQLGPGSGAVCVRELDWTVPPERWLWDHPTIIASQTCSLAVHQQQLAHPFDLIISADTIYDMALVTPFLRTLHALCTLSVAALSSSRVPVIYLCLERRDSAVIDRTFDEASTWGFTATRIAPRKLSKALVKSGLKWDREDWDGVEIWKLIFEVNRAQNS